MVGKLWAADVGAGEVMHGGHGGLAEPANVWVVGKDVRGCWGAEEMCPYIEIFFDLDVYFWVEEDCIACWGGHWPLEEIGHQDFEIYSLFLERRRVS